MVSKGARLTILITLVGCARAVPSRPTTPGPEAGAPLPAEPVRPGGPAQPQLPPVLQPGEVEESDKPAWMRGLLRPDLPLRWYPPVSEYLELYKNDPRHREIIASWLRRLPAYRGAIEEILAAEGLPTGLVFVAMIESGFSASALSNRGAGGFWQFRSDIGRAYGLEIDFWVDERRDLSKSTQAAALYLSDLYYRFQSWELALAGYNAGAFAVLGSIVRFNTNDFWTLCQLESGLPYETTHYVPRIFAAAIVDRNRAVFGFEDLKSEHPEPYAVVEAPPTAAFEALAPALGVEISDLERLNPAFIRGRIPPGEQPVALRVPAGRARSLAGQSWREFVRVRVASGQTVGRIARQRRIPREEIRRINRIRDDAEVTPGTVLLLPRSARAAPAPTPPARRRPD